MSSQSSVRDALVSANIMKREHLVLNSGLHTNVKVEMERLLGYERSMQVVRIALQDVFHAKESVVPVPRGALQIGRKVLPLSVKIIESTKLDKREFGFSDVAKSHIQQADEITVFEDVITTGGTPAAMARHLRQINPGVNLHLKGLWLRTPMLYEHGEWFDSTQFLVEEEISSWAAEECPYIHEDIA
jgi:orotate phosphoribosyltransferase